MHISLTPELEERVRAKVDSGLYNNASEVIREALRFMETSEALVEALKLEEEGDGAEATISAMPGTSLYQLTEKGLATQVTLQCTKFWKDKDLNWIGEASGNSIHKA